VLPGKTYKFLLVATYGLGQSVSGAGEVTFKTPAAAPPTVEAVKATVKGPNEATLEGKVDPNGGSATEYLFEYATAAEYNPITETYGQKTTPVTGLPIDNLKHTASTTVPGLHAGTVYHFRLVAKNSVGPVTSADGTFTTASTPPPKEPIPPPTNPNPTPTPPLAPGPIAPEPELAPLVPLLVQGSLKLVAPHHGATTLRGSLDVSQSGAGGSLEVDLIASSASLARRGGARTRQVVVGRTLRVSVPAGRVSFSVALNARGKSALRRHHRLALTVKVVLTPAHGATVTVFKSVLLRV
jgi:hypothetical protein